MAHRRVVREAVAPATQPPTQPAGTDRRIPWATLGREFFVTFVGLLLALVVNSWWQERQERRTELETLAEIRADLRTDSADVAGNLNGFAVGVAYLDSLTAVVDQRRVYTPRVDSLIQVMGWWLDHSRNAAGYATLKSRGIRIVTNDSLRRAITKFYETMYGEEDQHDRIVAAAYDRTQPMLHRYVRQPDYYKPAHPIDYQAMIRDAGFRAVLDEAVERMAGGLIFERKVEADVAGLSKAIDRELARRR